MNKTYDREKAHQQILKDLDSVRKYQGSMGFTKKFPTYVDFREGRQWPAPTKNTKGLPRPVINIVKMFCRNKKAAILSVPPRIVYHAETAGVGDELELKLNHFAAYAQKEMKLDAYDRDGIDDAVTKGSYFYHFYWDDTARGLDAVVAGGLRVENIDPLRIGFENPCERDEQKQKWILIISRENVSRVRQMADKGVAPSEIVPDEREMDGYGTVEQDEDELCTVLTRYFRVDGEVYFERATKQVMINAPRSLTPDVDAERAALKGEKKETPAKGIERAALYPIVAGSYERREGSIFGIGEVEGIIPNQKAVNFHIAMSLFNAQQFAWGKYIVMPNALNGQRITNEPGQVLVDYSKTGNGIKKMAEQGILSNPMELADSIITMTRAATGSTEVMTGETVGANMSGAAIAALQSQAQKPIEDLREAFWDVKRKQGIVMAQFFRLYYAGTRFTYKEQEKGLTKELVKEDVFDSSDYAGMRLDVAVETVRGSNSSNAGDINLLDSLLARNLIGLDGYLAAYPDDALSNKTDIREALVTEKQQENAQLKAQLQQLQAALQQMQVKAEADKQAVDAAHSIAAENKRLKEAYAKLYAEANTKIAQQNMAIRKLARDGMEVAADAREFAEHIAAEEGVQVPTGIPIAGGS